jgi:ComF family protein
VNAPYSLHKALWHAVDYLYPPTCAACGKSGYRLCPACVSQIQVINFPFCAMCGRRVNTTQSVCSDCATSPVHFSAATSWGKFGGALREAIHALKYKNDVGLGDFFADHLIQLLRDDKWDFDCVLPVPLSRERQKERQYNQSALISRPIARYFGSDHALNWLIRTHDTGSQTRRRRLERNLSLTGSFWANPAKLKGRSVLLVDDIITTGATINHCSAALLDAGVANVYAISIAKTFRMTSTQP